MKLSYILTLLPSMVVALTTSGQTTREEMLAHPQLAAGVYLPYPAAVPAETPVPRGYRPFYVSHYGRHGSRYLVYDTDYSRVKDALDQAATEGLLSPVGVSVKERVDSVWELARGRAGELAPLGFKQHHDIATRMYRACREAFSSTAHITAVSTVRMRCAHSMFAFVDALKEQNRRLDISMESAARYMPFLSYNTPEASHFNRDDGPWAKPVADFKAEMTQPERLMNLLFIDADRAKNIVNPGDLMWWLYWVAVDLPNLPTDITLLDIFTTEELFDLWQVFNYEFYTRNSCNPLNEGLFTDSAKSLLTNILSTADEYIANGETGATLRFGHDSTIIPLAGLLHFPGCDGRETNPRDLYKTYADWHVSPMASNVQLRFYRNKSREIIVKFLLNEHEVSIPCKTNIYPYYHWKVAREALQHILDTPSKNYNP